MIYIEAMLHFWHCLNFLLGLAFQEKLELLITY